MKILRGVLAIVAGFVAIAVLSLGADAVFRRAAPGLFGAGGRSDHLGVLLAMIAYSAVFATAGAWLTARLAPDRPLRHALILGGLGLALAVPVTIAHWHTAPVWFHVVTLALTLPAAWVGGTMVERRVSLPAVD
jgi:hypothetical protein